MGFAYFYISQPPPVGGICPLPDSDVLSSQAPTIRTIQAVKITSLFLGCICMSSPPLSDCCAAEAMRPDGGAQRRWCGIRSALHWEPTCNALSQTQGGWGVPSESNWKIKGVEREPCHWEPYILKSHLHMAHCLWGIFTVALWACKSFLNNRKIRIYIYGAFNT